ncbi:MAG: serine hydrolase domain-containing protein [Monoglobaceae bacterium]
MNFTRLSNYLDKSVDEYKIPGVDCAVYKEHELVFRYFTGKSDIENNKPINGDELYIIFSMTKMLTCTCALQLLEQGKFVLSDPISEYIPEFSKMKIVASEQIDDKASAITTGRDSGKYRKIDEFGYAKNQITFRDLFTMSAGFDYNLNADCIKEAIASGKKSTVEIVKSLSQSILHFEPGTRFQYSLCHDILGALVEIISGKKFGDYMQENIFEPLGMKNTFFGVPKDEDRLAKMAKRYAFDENGNPKLLPLECVYNFTDEYQSGGAGLISSTDDYALFLDAIANGGVGKSGNRILSPAAIELMRTNHLSGRALEDFYNLRMGYGYGLGVRTHLDRSQSGSMSSIGEFGWDGAAGAYSLVDSEKKMSLTYFQQIHASGEKWHDELKNVFYSCLD